jgi:hypothetical protein
VALQTGAPVVQDVEPVLQGRLGGGHGAFVVQLTQDPLELHTRFEPQELPALTKVGGFVFSPQVGVPVEQDCVPTWQGTGVQSVPGVQSLQLPALHTRFVPHPMPDGALPVSVQVCTPVAHEYVPVLQMLPPGEHAPFGVQDWQLPLEQKRFPCVPHGAPLASVDPVSVQDGAPPAHDSVPV